mmetsp:Transcript_10784/g.23088  ORF Transcript_10784/g.23088 Transcript_10784/m.23088 type:complete len:472 (+) Transcript_10784:1470-2885(+)
MGLQQRYHNKRGERGHQRLAQHGYVFTLLEGVENLRIGGRTAYAERLQLLDEGGLRVASRGLGLVPVGNHPAAVDLLPLDELRQPPPVLCTSFLHPSGGERSLVPGLLSLLIRRHPASLDYHLASGTEQPLAPGVPRLCPGPYVHARQLELRVHHHRRQRALEHQLVQRQLAPREARGFGRPHLLRAALVRLGDGRADRLVRLLAALGLVHRPPRPRRQARGAVPRGDTLAGQREGGVGEDWVVGAHVGDVAGLVERLGHAHGLLGRHGQLPACLLLQRGRDEGRGRLPPLVLGLEPLHLPQRVLVRQALGQLRSRVRVQPNQRLLPRLVAKRAVGGEVSARCQALPSCFNQPRRKVQPLALLLPTQQGLQVKISCADEGKSLSFPSHNQSQPHALNSACTQAGCDFPPQERRHRVPCQAVENSPCFLSMHQVGSQLSRRFECTSDSIASDLMKNGSLDGNFGLEELKKMP